MAMQRDFTMTQQDVVNACLTKSREQLEADYTRDQLMSMYYWLTGHYWGRVSASKHDVMSGLCHYIATMNRAAAFFDGKPFKVHTEELTMIENCIKRNSFDTVLKYLPEDVLLKAYRQVAPNGQPHTRAEMLRQVLDYITR